MKIAMIQSRVFRDKEENLRHIGEFFASGATDGADLVTLPEMFNCPYKTRLFPAYAEEEGGPSWQYCSDLAREYGVWLAAGSMPERDGDKVYNTCYVFDRKGRQAAKHRKVHLFDVNLGAKPFRESDTLTGGDTFEVFDTEFCRIGLNICYDIRFPESVRIPALKGAKIVLIPASFRMPSGRDHWEIGFRMRSIENQIFLVGNAAARDASIGYEIWAHSLITDPWGRVLTDMGTEEGVSVTEIDLAEIDKVQARLPLMEGRRTDLYEIRCREHREG